MPIYICLGDEELFRGSLKNIGDEELYIPWFIIIKNIGDKDLFPWNFFFIKNIFRRIKYFIEFGHPLFIHEYLS